jgi:hypothetical protein
MGSSPSPAYLKVKESCAILKDLAGARRGH